ncbi:PcfJ domain-containing protein [Fundidesulfovibrio soli]|uniref:PcfJ domain-containing protein n=1 Tax=Fundidesulfovibrio soli TaxID=2922716 RepID=UPI001FAEE17D|nr:PcfJ domain-containing protein [Fundidesulfovibrio soli]
MHIPKVLPTRILGACLYGDGVLQLDTFHLTPQRWRILPWDAGLEIWLREKNEWTMQTVPPEVILVHASTRIRASAAIKEFVASLPLATREAVGRFSWRQLALLSLSRRSARFLDLLWNCPPLAWMLADAFARGIIPNAEVMNLASCKRAEIVRRLTGRSVPGQLGLLGKVVIKDGSLSELEALKTAMSRDQVPWVLRHAQSVPLTNLEPLLSSGAFLASRFTRFEAEAQQSPHALRIAMALARDCVAMAGELGIADGQRIVMQAGSVAALRKLHDAWQGRFLAECKHAEGPPGKRPPLPVEPVRAPIDGDRFQGRGPGPEAERIQPQPGPAEVHYPPPPFPGSDAIQPITSRAELRREGAEMRHCVGSYHSRVLSGECYIYRVLSPTRATLELRLGKTKRIGQIKGYANRKVSDITRASIRAWFKGCLVDLLHK